jgi:hypothetical protein
VFAANIVNDNLPTFLFFPPNGSGDPSVGGTWTTFSQMSIPMPVACTFDTLYVSFSTVPQGMGGGSAITVTLFKNGAPTPLAASGDSLVPTPGHITGGSVSVVPGDLIALEATGVGVSSGASTISASLHCGPFVAGPS